MRVPPALVALALLAGCLAPAGAPGVAYSLSGFFTVLALPGDVDEMAGVVLAEGGHLDVQNALPPVFIASGLTPQGCRLVYEFALTRVYLEAERLGTCEIDAVSSALE